jgi:hypothetical protein
MIFGMNIINADLYKSDIEYKCFLSNGVIKNNGELVMGAGTANIIKVMHPELPLFFGQQIKLNYFSPTNIYKYGIIISEQCKIIAVQTKYHYRDKADLELIEYSLNKLITLRNVEIGLPLPGVGLGGLHINDVAPLLENLPKNIKLYEYTN